MGNGVQKQALCSSDRICGHEFAPLWAISRVMIKVAELCVDDCFLDAVEYMHRRFFELDVSILGDVGVHKVPNQHARIRFYW